MPGEEPETKTYLVRGRADAYWVAQVEARSAPEALQLAGELSYELEWFEEGDDGYLEDRIDTLEVIDPSDTSVTFPTYNT